MKERDAWRAMVGGGLFEEWMNVATRGVVGCRFRFGSIFGFFWGGFLGGGKRLPKFKSYLSLLGLGGTLRLRRLKMYTQTAFQQILLGLIDAERELWMMRMVQRMFEVS